MGINGRRLYRTAASVRLALLYFGTELHPVLTIVM